MEGGYLVMQDYLSQCQCDCYEECHEFLAQEGVLLAEKQDKWLM